MDNFKEIPRHIGYYANERGEVISMKNGFARRLKACLDTDGYWQYCFITNKKRFSLKAHRIVMQTFNPQKDKERHCIDHINGVKTDNNLNNLRWCTPGENTRFNIELTGHSRGSKNPRARASEKEMLQILKFYSKTKLKNKYPVKCTMEKFGINLSRLEDLIYKRSWPSVWKKFRGES